MVNRVYEVGLQFATISRNFGFSVTKYVVKEIDSKLFSKLRRLYLNYKNIYRIYIEKQQKLRFSRNKLHISIGKE